MKSDWGGEKKLLDTMREEREERRRGDGLEGKEKGKYRWEQARHAPLPLLGPLLPHPAIDLHIWSYHGTSLPRSSNRLRLSDGATPVTFHSLTQHRIQQRPVYTCAIVNTRHSISLSLF